MAGPKGIESQQQADLTIAPMLTLALRGAASLMGPSKNARWSNNNRRRGTQQQDDGGDVGADVVRAQAIDQAQQEPGKERTAHAAETANDGHDEGQCGETNGVGWADWPGHGPGDRHETGKGAAKKEDKGPDRRGVDANQAGAYLVLDNRSDTST